MGKFFSNPFKSFSSNFEIRSENNHGVGGNLNSLNWFKGNTSPFYGVRYMLSDKTSIAAEYNPDLMSLEALNYLDMESHWNFGLQHKINKYTALAAQYLHGNQISLTANFSINPNRAPLNGGRELAPVPMRLRNSATVSVLQSQAVIRTMADEFKINFMQISDKKISINVTNTKFRSTAQAVGRISSTLQDSPQTTLKLLKFLFRILFDLISGLI